MIAGELDLDINNTEFSVRIHFSDSLEEAEGEVDGCFFFLDANAE